MHATTCPVSRLRGLKASTLPRGLGELDHRPHLRRCGEQLLLVHGLGRLRAVAENTWRRLHPGAGQSRTPSATIATRAARYLAALVIIVTLNFLLPGSCPAIAYEPGERSVLPPRGALDELKTDLGLDQPLLVQYGRYLGGLLTATGATRTSILRPVRNALRCNCAGRSRSCCVRAYRRMLAASWEALRMAGARERTSGSRRTLFVYSMPHTGLPCSFSSLQFSAWLVPAWPRHVRRRNGPPYLLDVGWHMLLPLVVITSFKAVYDFLIVRSSVVSSRRGLVLMAQRRVSPAWRTLPARAPERARALVTVTATSSHGASARWLVEVVFSWPGMGTLIYDAIAARDYPCCSRPSHHRRVRVAANFMRTRCIRCSTRGPGSDAVTEHVRHNRLALAGVALFAAFVLGALLAPLLAPHDPWRHFAPFLSPTATHLMGTDDVGRDIFSELITGARVSLAVGLLSGLLAVSLGVLAGLSPASVAADSMRC